MGSPRFASASASGGELAPLLAGICDRALAALGEDGATDLAVLFVTPDFGASVSEAGPWILRRTGARRLLGCTGGGVIGAEAEHEGGGSAALLLARLPGARIEPFRLVQGDLEGSEAAEEVRNRLPIPGKGDPASLLLLADPFTIDGEALLARIEDAFPGRPVMGGLASGAAGPGGHVLWLDGEVLRDGAAGVALAGVRVGSLVSQGCRPIGRRFTVTRSEGPRIATLAGKPAIEALRETVAALSPEDQRLARSSLHFGRVAHEARAEFHRGDFLIRNLVGMVPEDGSLVVGDHVEVGQTVQFQLRDAASATEDLAALLDEQARIGTPEAALLFSCGGRGSRMFGEPDHDLGLIREKFGAIPIAGFFCNGEIGPVGSRSFLHGFTSSLALFRPA